MFANLLLIPFALLTFLFLYLSWTVDRDYAPWMIPFLVISAIIFILSPQINWWWYTRHPKDLQPELKKMLEKFCLFYNRLTPDDQVKFRQRIGLYILATDWTPMGFPEDNLPPDLQLMLAAQAITLSFRKPEFLFPRFEKIIIYPTSFHTPEYQFLHASELYAADGCLIFSGQHVVASYVQPGKMYNVGLHEYAKVFVLTYPDEAYPELEAEDVWPRLQLVSGLSREQVESATGIAGIDALPVAIHHYFMYPERFQVAFPEEAPIFEQIFSA